MHLDLRAFTVGDGLGIVAADITERKCAEDALRQSEEKLRNILQNSIDVIMTVDRAGTILSINRPGPGLAAEQVVGRNSMELIPAEHREGYERALEKVFADGNGEHVEHLDVGSTW